MLLKELFDFLPKSSRPASYGQKDGLFPFFTSSNTIDKYVDTPDYEGEFLIIGDGGTGNCKYYKGKFSASDHNYLLKPKNNTNCNLVRYFLMKDNYKVLNDGFKGVGIKNISKTYIQNINFCKKMNISDDKMISTLSNIENMIDNLNFELNQLDELIKSRFIEMFSGIKAKKTLESLTTKITDGSHLPPKGIEKSDYLMLSSQNVYDELNLLDVRYLTKEDFEKENKRTNIQKGDVLLTIVGTIGRTYVVKETDKYVFQRSVGVIKPLNNILNGTYLSEYLKTPEAIHQLETGGHGSSQKGIYLKDLKQLLIPLADYSKQIEFENYVNLIDKSKFIVQKQIKGLEELLESKMEAYFENKKED